MPRFEMKSLRTIVGTCLSTMILSGASAFAQDIFMHDCPADIGNTPPSYACGGSWYLSPDVILKITPVYTPNQDAPVANQPAYIFVTLHNRGTQPSCSGKVHLYYRDAGTGLSNFPANWTQIPSPIAVYGIPAGGSQQVMFTWANVPPNVTPGQHYCLLAVWDDDACDPITAVGPSIYSLVPGDNNIVHKNCLPTTPGCPRRPISVFHIGPNDMLTRLRMMAHRNENGRTAFDMHGFQIKVILGRDLYALWTGPHDGPGIQDLPNEYGALITTADAQINGINLPAGDEKTFTNFVVNVEMQYPDRETLDEEAAQGNIYTWTITQEDDEHPDGGDGMGFDIHTAEDPGAGGNGGGGKRVAPVAADLAATLALSVRPNITSGSSVFSFTLGEHANVSLAVFDASGRLVRTLLSSADRQAGANEIEWDGKASGGALVPNGTYFYRLTTPAGTAERQIKIVR